jgi:hypothetical protein
MPSAKNPADLSSIILKHLNFVFDANPTDKGIFLDPGEMTTSVIPCFIQESRIVCADGIVEYIIQLTNVINELTDY